MGHATSKDLDYCYNVFKDQMEWDETYLMQVGMNGTAVNNLYLCKNRSIWIGKEVIDIGSPNLHNAFRGCVKVLILV